MNTIRESFLDALEVLKKFIGEEANLEIVELAATKIVDSLKNGGKVITCGNGGSMCDAMHFAEELTGRFRNDRESLASVAISDPAHITCVANDYGFDYIFSRFVEGVGSSNDVLLGISTSGNSQNIINAVKSAKEKGMFTIILSGKTGGKLANICDLEIRVPWNKYSDRIQEIHIKIIHIIIQRIEELYFTK